MPTIKHTYICNQHTCIRPHSHNYANTCCRVCMHTSPSSGLVYNSLPLHLFFHYLQCVHVHACMHTHTMHTPHTPHTQCGTWPLMECMHVTIFGIYTGEYRYTITDKLKGDTSHSLQVTRGCCFRCYYKANGSVSTLEL